MIECPVIAHKRSGSCAGKGLPTEAGLKSPIFYSNDFAIDGAAMLEKLSAMQMEGIVSKNVRGTVPVGAERILVEDQLRAAGQVSGCRLCEGSAGVATLHLAKLEGKDFVYAGKVGTGFNRKSSMGIHKKLDAIVSSKSRLVKAPRLKGRELGLSRGSLKADLKRWDLRWRVLCRVRRLA